MPGDMDVDRELLGRLLRQAEADVHRGGWDEPEQVWVLVDAAAHPDTAAGFRRAMGRMGQGTRVGCYLSQPLLPPMFFRMAGEAPYTALRRFAMNLAYAGEESEATRQMLEILRSPGVIGFAFCGESWRRTISRDEGQRVLAGDVHLGDMPGSVEVRYVIAVTVTGAIVTVERARGAKPVVMTDEDALRGDFSTSLRVMCAAVTDTVPPRERFNEVFPSLAEAAGA